MTIITKSEEIRLRSLKEKKRAYKAKEHLIQKALSDINTTAQNKIVFDDELNKQQSQKTKSKNLKADLFDSDNDDEVDLSNEDQFSTNKHKHKMIALGNDARFTLDDRFAEGDHQSKKTEFVENTYESDLQTEKEKQLDILESILGTPLTTKFQETQKEIKPAKKGLMIRYDPTESKHCEYEVQVPAEQLECKEKRMKKRKLVISKPEIEKPTTVEVSKDTYYSVSNTLTESLKQKEEFSLLKLHGKGKDNTENERNDHTSVVENKDKTIRLNFNAHNVFYCDSTDDEEINTDKKKQMLENNKNNHTNSFSGYKDTLFFEKDDARFNEAVKFFSAEAISSDEFNTLRRKLKLIVRSKIRNNEKKTQQHKKRKVRKVQ